MKLQHDETGSLLDLKGYSIVDGFGRLSGDQLQKVLDDLDLAKLYVPPEVEPSIRYASEFFVAYRELITGESSSEV